MDKRQDNILWQEDLPSAAQHEDAALKTTMRFLQKNSNHPNHHAGPECGGLDWTAAV